jgi:hypothetical protein
MSAAESYASINPLARRYSGDFMGVTLMDVTPEIYPDVRQWLRRHDWRLYDLDFDSNKYVFRTTVPFFGYVRKFDVIFSHSGSGVTWKYKVVE